MQTDRRDEANSRFSKLRERAKKMDPAVPSIANKWQTIGLFCCGDSKKNQKIKSIWLYPNNEVRSTAKDTYL